MRTECEQSGPLHWCDRPALMAENDRLRAEVEALQTEVKALRSVEFEWLEIVNDAWAEVPEPLRVEFSKDTGARHPLAMSVKALRTKLEALEGAERREEN